MMQSLQEHLLFLKKKSIELRLKVLNMISAAGSGSTGSVLSALDIIIALYYGQIHDGKLFVSDPAKPGYEHQDYFVLSKAQAAPALYAVLADLGFFSFRELDFYKKTGSFLQACPTGKVPGVMLGTGSAGHGFAQAVGLAQSLKIDHNNNHVFVMTGDAELEDGIVWEAAMHAAQNKLDNLVAIIDRNSVQIEGLVRNVNITDPIAEKFEAFGWRAINVYNGHDFDELIWSFEKAINVQRLPVALICKTVKGKGVSFVEGKTYYHNLPLSEQELAAATVELEEQLKKISND
jgi:transketolase